MVETIRFIQGNLPHWLVADCTYFVTMRLNGTLPRSVVDEMIAGRQQLVDAGCDDDELWLNLYRKQFLEIEGILDAVSDGTAYTLTHPEVGRVILASFDWLAHEAGWVIRAATIMPTHIHVVMRNDAGRSGALMDDLEKLKRFTGREANKILKRRGRFWAREDFDHWCRTPEKVAAAVRYVRNNPVKAGLVRIWQDWEWTV
jgi:putative transposase